MTAKRPWFRRLPKSAFAGLATLPPVLLVSLALGGVWLRGERGNDWLRRQIVDVVQGSMTEGRFRVGRLETDLWSTVVLEEIKLTDGAGKRVASVARARATFSLGSMLGGTVVIDELWLDGVELAVDTDADGALNLGKLWASTQPPDPSPPPWDGLPVDVLVSSVHLRGADVSYGSQGVKSLDFRALQADLAVNATGPRIAVEALDGGGHVRSPFPLFTLLSGEVVYRGDGLDLNGLVLTLPQSRIEVDGPLELAGEVPALDLTLRSDALRLRDLDVATGFVGLRGSYATEIGLKGPLDALSLTGDLAGIEDTRGELGVRLGADLMAATPTWSGTLSLRGVHVEDPLPMLGQPVVLEGLTTLEGRGLSWPGDLTVDGRYVADGPQQAFGFELADLVGPFRVEKGRLRLSEFAFDGVIGQLSTTGEIDLVNGPMDLRITGSIDPKRLASLGVEGLSGRGRLDAQVRGHILELDRPFRINATAELTPLVYNREVRVERAVAKVTAKLYVVETGVELLGSLDVDAYDVDAYDSARVRSISGRTLRFVYDGEGDVGASGELTLGGMGFGDTAGVESGALAFAVDLPKRGAMEVSADLEMGRFWVSEVGGTQGELTATLSGDQLRFTGALLDGERAFGFARGEYDLGTGAVDIPTLSFTPTPDIDLENTAPIRMVVAPDAIRDIRVGLAGPSGRIGIKGNVELQGEVALDVALDRFDLALISKVMGEDVPVLAGKLTVESKLVGPSRRPRLTGRFAGRNLSAEGVFRPLDIEGTLGSGDGVDTLAVDLTLHAGGEPLADLVGSVPVHLGLDAPGPRYEDPVDLELIIRPGRAERLLALAPSLDAVTQLQGDVSAKFTVTGPLKDPHLSGSGVAEVAVSGWSEPGRLEFGISRRGDELDGWADLREGYAPRARVTLTGASRLSEAFAYLVGGAPAVDFADYSLYADEVDVSALLVRVPMSSVTRVVGAPVALSGELDGGFRVTGSPYTPVLDGALHWVDGRIGDTPVQEAYASVNRSERGYQVDIQSTFGEDGMLSVTGTVPVAMDLRTDWQDWANGNMEVDVAARLPLSLASAVDPGVRNAEGALEVGGRIGGDPLNPTTLVVATLEDGQFVYPPLGLRVSELQTRFVQDAAGARLEIFSARTAPSQISVRSLDALRSSKVEASGSVLFDGWTPTAVNGRVDLDDTWIANTPTLTGRVRGGVKLQGSWPRVEILGDPGVELTQGHVFLDSASFLQTGALKLSPLVEIHREGMELRDRAVEEIPPLYQDFVVRVPVTLNRQVEGEALMPFLDDFGTLGAAVTSINVQARVGSDGQLLFELLDGEPHLTGTVEVIEGKVGVLRSRLDLDEGTINFIGDQLTNPTVDIASSMTLPGASVQLLIRGTAEQPEVTLSSDEYPEQTQILTILITGRAPDDLSADQGKATAQALAGLLINSVFSQVQLGTVSIESDGSVTVGVPVSGRIFFESTLNPSPDLGENRVSVEGEFTIAPRLVAVVGGGNRRGWVDMFWEFRF